MRFDRELQRFADLLPHLIWNFSVSSKDLTGNRKWCEYTGLQPASQTEWMSKILHPEDYQRLMEEWGSKAESRHGLFSTVARMGNRKGEWRWFLLEIVPEVNEHDRWIATATDIHDLILQNQSEKSLRFLNRTGVVLSESLDYETVFKAAAILTLEFLAEMCVIDLIEEAEGEKPHARRIVSMHKDVSKDTLAGELTQHPPRWRPGDLIYEIVQSGHHLLLPDVVRALRDRVGEDSRCTEILSLLDCGPALVTPLESHGHIFGTISLIRSRDREQFSDSEVELVGEFARRAGIAIENARLLQAAQRANEAKSEFLANISHEIRTPLGAIIGFTELMREENPSPEECRRYLEIVHRNGRQLYELIGDLLDLSKIESGKDDLNCSDIALKVIVEDVAAMLSFKAAERHLKIVTDYAPGLPERIYSDQLKIRQILINLLGNAIKFSSGGRIAIRVRALEVQGKNQIAIDVEDNGIGISPEKQKRLFQAFTQADSSMARRFGGSGLGLFLSKKLAQALGGDVTLLSSEIDKGSTFRITLLHVPAQPDGGEAQQVWSSDRPTLLRESRRLLVVDDSRDNQLLISHLLKGENVSIDFANDGSEAVEKGVSGDYDLIVMDIQMPVVDGYTATRRLRDRGVQVPIIAVTAHALREDREKCLAAGCTGYITKPIEAKSFRQTIRGYL
jgi:two-component system, sensor histidine kinase